MALPLLLSCSSSVPAPSDNISFDLPPALTKAAAAGDLVARFVGMNGSQKKEIDLKIEGDKVSGSMTVKPGKWTFEVQFYQVAKGGDLLPVAFFHFGEKSVEGQDLQLSYKSEEIQFDEPEPKDGVSSRSLSPSHDLIPQMCKEAKKKYDCDGDGVPNFREIQAGSDPFDPKSKPEVKKEPPAITVNLIEGQTVRDAVTIIAEAKSQVGIKSLFLIEPAVEDNDKPSTAIFNGVWNTTLPQFVSLEDKEVTLTFVAKDLEDREGRLVRKVKIDNVPNIASLVSDKPLIQSGETARLSWKADNFSTLEIDNSVGDVKSLTGTPVKPSKTTTYTLTARRGVFSETRPVKVMVNRPPFVPTRVFSQPLGLLPDAVNFEWSSGSPAEDDPACQDLKYDLMVHKSDGTVALSRSNLGETSFRIKLEPRTDYRWFVTAKDNCGGAATNPVPFSFTTADTGLVGWWRFEDNALDSSGKGNNGTLKSAVITGTLPSRAIGISGSALQFDGTDDYVEIPHNVAFNDATALTLEAWIQPGKVKPSGSQFIVGKYLDGTSSDSSFRLALRSEGAPDFVDIFVTQNEKGSNYILSQTTSSSFTSGAWVHVVGVWDGGRSPNALKVYLNGVQVSTAGYMQGLFTQMGNSKEPVRIGVGKNSSDGLKSFFNGLIDEVAVYNRALSAKEIRQSCSRTSGTICNPLEPVPVNPIGNGTFAPDAKGIFPNVDWTTASEATYTWSLYKLPTATADKSRGTSVKENQATSTPSVDLNGTLDYWTSYLMEVKACDAKDPSRCVTRSWNFTTTQFGLVGWWRFDEGSGTVAKDSSGGGHDMTLKQGGSSALPAWDSGILNVAFDFAPRFDGSSNYLRTNSPQDLGFVNAWTISFWVNLSVDAGNLQSFFSIGNMSGIYDGETILGEDVGRDYILARTGYNHRDVEVIYRGGDATKPEIGFRTPDNILTASTWYHVAITYSGGTDLSAFRIYLNGVKQQILSDYSSPVTVPPQAVSGSRRLMVGRDLDLSHKKCGNESNKECALFGKLDEFAIYNRALSTTEIRASCQRNNPAASICATDDVPDQVTPRGEFALPPTRAFLSWTPGISGKPVHHYQLCYTTAGDDLTDPGACLNPRYPMVAYYALDSLKKNNTGYRWKVRTCYNAKGTDCSDYSPVWSFSTDDSLVGWWKFDDHPFINETDPCDDQKFDMSGSWNFAVPLPSTYPYPSSSGPICDSSGKGNVGVAYTYPTFPEKMKSRRTSATETLSGVTVDGVPGITGGALSLDGVDDYVSFGYPKISLTSTIEGRFYFKDRAFDRGVTMRLFDDVLYQHWANNFLYIKSTNDYFNWTPELNRWYHLALTYSSGDSKTAKLYVDGELKNIIINSHLTSSHNIPDFFGTISVKTVGEAFNGFIDDVSVSNTPRSPEVVKNNFCALEALAGSDLKAKGCL